MRWSCFTESRTSDTKTSTEVPSGTAPVPPGTPRVLPMACHCRNPLRCARLRSVASSSRASACLAMSCGVRPCWAKHQHQGPSCQHMSPACVAAPVCCVVKYHVWGHKRAPHVMLGHALCQMHANSRLGRSRSQVQSRAPPLCARNGHGVSHQCNPTLAVRPNELCRRHQVQPPACPASSRGRGTHGYYQAVHVATTS